MYVRYTICYLGSIMIMGAYCVGSIMIIGAYCVGKVHNMLPQSYYDIRSILCR